MCCCRLPPIPGIPGGILALIAYGILFNLITLTVKGLYLIGPANINIKSINTCPGWNDDKLKSEFNMTNHEGEKQRIDGTFHLDFTIDENVLMTIRVMRKKVVKDKEVKDKEAEDKSFEDELTSFKDKNKGFENKDKPFENKDKPFENKDKTFENIDKSLESKDKTFENKDKTSENKDKTFENKDKTFENKDKSFEDNDKSFKYRDESFEGKIGEEWVEDKIFIFEKSVCRILDNYAWEMEEVMRSHNWTSVCPIPQGKYQIKNFRPNFSRAQFSAAMVGDVKFQIEFLEADGARLACKEFTLENSLAYPNLD